MTVEAFFDPRTWTLTYLVYDAVSRDAVVIDPVLDYDSNRVRVFEDSIKKVMARVQELGLKLHWSLETHAHADHLSGAWRLKELAGARIAIGARFTRVQSFFAGLFGLPAERVRDGAPFDALLEDGQVLEAGTLRVRTIATPGHTPACVSYLIDDALFTGDALFLPDSGTGRCDFPNGSASDLYDSIMKLYALPDSTRVFVGHDYQPNGRKVEWESTIGEQKSKNIQIRAGTGREEYVQFRTARDKTLALPNLIFQSLQVNVCAGQLPDPDANGRRFLKLPINLFDPS